MEAMESDLGRPLTEEEEHLALEPGALIEQRRSLLDGEPELLPRSRPPMPVSLSTEKIDLLLRLTAPASQRRPTAIMLALAYPEPGTNLG